MIANYGTVGKEKLQVADDISDDDITKLRCCLAAQAVKDTNSV